MTVLERVQCSAMSKQTGRQCRNRAILGGTVCRFHGASSKVRAAAARRVAEEELRAELTMVGVELKTEPLPVVALRMVGVWRGTEVFLRQRVQELDQLTRESRASEDALVALLGGGKEAREVSAKAPAGVYGRVDPRNFRAERHVVYAMWEDASDRVMRYVKMCREAGVEEARLAIEMDQGRQLAEVIRGTLQAVLVLILGVLEAAPAGLADQVRAVWAEAVPSIVREQIGVVVGAEGEQ